MRIILAIFLLPIILLSLVKVVPFLVVIGIYLVTKKVERDRQEEIWNDPERW